MGQLTLVDPVFVCSKTQQYDNSNTGQGKQKYGCHLLNNPPVSVLIIDIEAIGKPIRYGLLITNRQLEYPIVERGLSERTTDGSRAIVTGTFIEDLPAIIRSIVKFQLIEMEQVNECRVELLLLYDLPKDAIQGLFRPHSFEK
ncbi:hypothetical protein D3C81_1101490 [compost metagenome]